MKAWAYIKVFMLGIVATIIAGLVLHFKKTNSGSNVSEQLERINDNVKDIIDNSNAWLDAHPARKRA